MKNYILTFFVLFGFISNTLYAQADRDSTEISNQKIYVITTYNGGEFIGKILKKDDKEVTIETKDRGKVTIPKYEIKEMKEVQSGEMNAGGVYIPEELFATRYFLTTNGLPIEKGKHYALINLYGPEVHFAVAKNFSLGIMTTWVGIPIIGSAKYSIELGKDLHLGIGVLAGTGSWGNPNFGLALPYGALTIGNSRTNLNISAGYGMSYYEGDNSGTALYSVGFMSKIGSKVSFIFDSFFFTYDRTQSNYNYNNSGSAPTVTYTIKKRYGGVIIPGLRIQGKSDSSFQFGFLGAFDDNDWLPIPIPMLGWFRKF